MNPQRYQRPLHPSRLDKHSQSIEEQEEEKEFDDKRERSKQYPKKRWSNFLTNQNHRNHRSKKKSLFSKNRKNRIMNSIDEKSEYLNMNVKNNDQTIEKESRLAKSPRAGLAEPRKILPRKISLQEDFKEDGRKKRSLKDQLERSRRRRRRRREIAVRKSQFVNPTNNLNPK